MDDLVERLARKLAAHTSRRRLLGMIGTALLGGMALPLLPVQRIARAAEAADSANEPGDQLSCDYWRYCGFDGKSLRMLRWNAHRMSGGVDHVTHRMGWHLQASGRRQRLHNRLSGLLRKRVLRALCLSRRQGRSADLSHATRQRSPLVLRREERMGGELHHRSQPWSQIVE